jgi:multiple antibiotic resistance protein
MDLELARFALVTFTAVFFVVDPFAVVPAFIAMTEGDSAEKRRGMARRASVAAFVILLVFALAGRWIFQLFGITAGAFRVAGGLLLFLLSVDMMRALPSRVRTSPEEEREGAARDDVAVIPLGMPLLAGPGSIATVTVLVAKAKTPPRIAVVLGAVALTCLLTYVVLRAAPLVERRLGRTGINVLTRVMGLILAAVAVQFVADGVKELLPYVRGTVAR